MDIPQAWGSEEASEEGWGEGHSTDQDMEARGSVPFQSHMQSSQQHEVQDDSDPQSGAGEKEEPSQEQVPEQEGPVGQPGCCDCRGQHVSDEPEEREGLVHQGPCAQLGVSGAVGGWGAASKQHPEERGMGQGSCPQDMLGGDVGRQGCEADASSWP